MRWSLKVATVAGVPVYLHLTFFLILPVFAFFFAFQGGTILGLEVGFGRVDLAPLPLGTAQLLRFALGTLAAGVFFACVFLHELGHALVALRHGAKIGSVVLLLYGGFAQMEMTRRARPQLEMAFVGPVVNLAIAGLGLGLLQLALPLLVATFLSIVTFYNLALGLLNLVPAFPLDGGKALRAGLSRRLTYLAATRVTAGIGTGLALLLLLAGLLALPNPWLLVASPFVFLGAVEEARAAQRMQRMEGAKVRDLMEKDVPRVSKRLTIVEFLERSKTEGVATYLVVDGQPEGTVSYHTARRVPVERQGLTVVSQIMKGIIPVDSNADAIEAWRLMAHHQVDRLVAYDGEDVSGLLTRVHLGLARGRSGNRRLSRYRYR